MSRPRRPKGEFLSAQREGRPVSPPGRPKGESPSALREGSRVSQPLYTVAQLRAIEAAALGSLPAGTLMQRAGAAAARHIHVSYGPQPRNILVLCGPGNNGGDGYVCASELRALGHRVRCLASSAPTTDEAVIARAQWGGQTMSRLPTAADRPVVDVVVDALFGIGLRRPVEGPYSEQLAWLRQQPAPVVALDVPSGLDADTGSWVGAVPGVCAASTVTFLGAKPGLYTGTGAEAAGRVLVDDLGASAWGVATDGRLNAPDQFAAVARPRLRNAHKGSHGNVAIVGGSAGMVGAALLAARAALRLGAGRVFVDCIGAPELRFDPAQPELMFRHRDAALLRSLQALVIGCGLGTSAEALAATQLALEQDCAVVLDADALNLIASAPQLERAARRPTRGVRICTPHPLEAARLLGSSVDEVQRDRVAAARRLAERLSSAIVLKGAGSVIAWPDGHYWINDTGSAALATAGTGDVLAGILGALLAQGFGAAEAVLAAVWLHGRAADLHSADVGLVASEVAPLAVRALVELRAAGGRGDGLA